MTSITITDPRPVKTETPAVRRRWSISALVDSNRVVIRSQDNA
jgi:hypothetical protein